MGIRQLMMLAVACSVFLITSCGQSSSKKTESKTENQTTSVDSSFQFTSNIKYAKGFKIERHDGYKELSVMDPWNKGEIFQKYYLIPRGKKQKLSLPSDGQIIEVPVRSIASLSNTQIGILNFLGVLDKVVAVSMPDRIYSDDLNKRIEKGEVAGAGSGQGMTFDFEKIIDISPELVMVSGYMKISNDEAKLIDAGLPVAFNIEWMESSLLARAEWAKFIAAFFNKEEKADKLFTSLEERYLNIKSEINHVTNRPGVISGYHFKGIWYMPGGQSYLAQLLRDAKGDYCWFSDSSQGSIPLSFEVVLEKQSGAKIWFGPAQCRSLKEMADLDERYTLFQAYRDGQVYSMTKRKNEKGANDYFESGVIRPDLMLKDVAKILHPELFPDYDLYFYQKLE
ncbi:ABC transporter substrate-binding protein [Ancylomarina salipaludis]|uniref:ABC transporter substrate-binding protein n=1 Tax=Ancylomarina salipaludis TaxID=2501299 RepID=A0A4Q1JKR7_9BACT|nr:ABC transporter substrate-binding protein [Ancylomarina salipaludis]RXQ93906.1 ABC transporter substrate-binding protein [Ancylomarina salipaludis]